MTEQSPEEAAHAHARAVVSGDIGATVRGLTPEGLARAMEIGNTSWQYSGYDVAPQGSDGEDYLFDIIYQTDLGPLRLRYRLRDVGGEWKVVDIERRS